MPQKIIDATHELRIRIVRAVMCAAGWVARWSSIELKRLCNSRSARQVANMERAKGLQ